MVEDFNIARGKMIAGFLVVFAFYACYAYAAGGFISSRSYPPTFKRVSAHFTPVTPPLGYTQSFEQSWSQYSPYFPREAYKAPPEGCKVNQMNLLQRHGARYPTSGAGAAIQTALAKILAVREYTDPQLDFLRNFTYDLGTNDLVPYGAAQSFDGGQETFERYGFLVSEDNLPFVRSDSSDRVVQSANNWTAGFSYASNHRFMPTLNVILNEAGNDTLDDNMCPNAGSSSNQTNEWLATYAPPITAHLNAGAPHANLTDSDTASLLSLCPFETIAKEKPSPFCTIFEGEGAVELYGYSGDLDKYYGTGYGQPLGPVQGVGYVNELLARLTNTPVQDHTQTNHTLDSSPDTFPLNRTVYADFSHDNQMIAIYSAIGLFHQAVPPSPTKPVPKRTWRAAWLVSFGARMHVERMECAGQGRQGDYVRILVSEEVQPLEFCGADADGLCSVAAFVESQAYARNDGEGDFEKCFS